MLLASIVIPICSGNVLLKLGLSPGAYLVKELSTISTLENELYLVSINLEPGTFKAWLNSLYSEIFISKGMRNNNILSIINKKIIFFLYDFEVTLLIKNNELIKPINEITNIVFV